jgi:hypothetical protein
MATLEKGCHEGFYAFRIFGKDILFAKTILTLPAGSPKTSTAQRGCGNFDATRLGKCYLTETTSSVKGYQM